MRVLLKVSFVCLVSGFFGVLASIVALSATGSVAASYFGASVAGAIVGLVLGIAGLGK